MALEDRSLDPLAPGAPSKPYYTPGEIARFFGVTPKTVSNWCDAGKIPSIVTPSGHRRIPASAIKGGQAGLAGWQAMQEAIEAKSKGHAVPSDEAIADQVLVRRHASDDAPSAS